jgi:hypothetical protein
MTLRSWLQKPKRQSGQSIESLHPAGQPNSHHFCFRVMEGMVRGEEEPGQIGRGEARSDGHW